MQQVQQLRVFWVCKKSERARGAIKQGSIMQFKIGKRSGLAVCFLFVMACSSAEKHSADSKGSASEKFLPAAPPAGKVLTPISWRYSAKQVSGLCKAELKRLDFDGGAPMPKDGYELDAVLTSALDVLYSLHFLSSVHGQQDVRDASTKCEEDTRKAFLNVFTNRSLYAAVKRTIAKTTDEKSLLADQLRGFEKSGMSLNEDGLDQLRAWKSKLTELEVEYQKNINEDKSVVLFTEQELDGLSADKIASFKKDKSGKLIVTTKAPDYVAVMKSVKNGEVRRQMNFAYSQRGGDRNLKLLSNAIELRQKIANQVKYGNWVDHQTDGRMAKNSAAPWKLLNDLEVAMKPALKRDLAMLTDMKRKELKDSKAELLAWDVQYYEELIRKTKYNIDNEAIRAYLPFETVVNGMFQIYQTLLDVEFSQVENADVWHESVKLFAVKNKGQKEIIAYFFMDMFPREAKYSHAAAFTLMSGYKKSNGSYSVPVSAIVANFSPPTENKPSLLTMDETKTLFHEFGHIMHGVLTRVRFATISGNNVAWDFVEAPSQMLENWVLDPGMMQIFTGHYKDPKKKLPASEAKKLIQARDLNQGYFYGRQLTFGLTDLTLHMSKETLDPQTLFNEVHKKVIGLEPVEGSKHMAGFGHLMGGYEGGYYGYIWSEVIAADMFTKFKRDGMLSASAGRDYRRTILERGAAEDPQVLVEKFLGRKTNNKAFLKKLGLQ